MKNIYQSQKENFKKLGKEIKKAKKILILSHRAPDGDAIGGMLALALYLRQIKKRVYVYSSVFPNYLKFLPQSNILKRNISKDEKFDLIFAIDYADARRIDVPLNFKIDTSKVISIDHHLLSAGKKIGKIKIIESSASSVCEVLYYFFKTTRIKITKDIATLLLCGIFSDTIAFARLKDKNKGVVVDLIKFGGEISIISKQYFKMSFAQAKILHRVLERLKEDEEVGLMYSWVSWRDFSEIKREFGKNQVSEIYLQEPPIFPDFISHIGDAKLYLFLVEFKRNKIKGSLRSSDGFNVSKLAENFGGGGHKEASGFFTKGTIEDVLKEVKKNLKKQIK